MTKLINITDNKYLPIEDNGPSVRDYFALMKPRVMSLVVFTALVGMILAPGSIHPVIAFSAILFTSIGAGSAAAINMWYDRDIDKIMKRTQNRPTVTGIINPDEALAFGVLTGIFSVILMALCVNIMSAALLLFSILYYVFIYTIWLKRTSVQNVVIGGVAGAFPPMIGWAAVTGGISIESIALFMIIFIWTPPHSWALALHRLNDYKECSVPMMPVIKGEEYTKLQILIYSLLMVISSFVPYYLGMTNNAYLVISVISGVVFLYYVYRLFVPKYDKAALTLFVYSIFYLFLLFFSLMIIFLLK